MNWIKENKFLTGFLAVMLVGVGALGYLLWSAKSEHEAAIASYQEKAAELTNLAKQPVFPSEKNVAKLVAQKKQVADKADQLAKALAAQQIPAEEMTPAQFQDKLKAAVTALRTKANQAGKPVQLGEATDKFFLGFEKYETAPPDANAAVALGRQLKVIDWVVGKMIELGVKELKVTRPDLPEEKEKEKKEDEKKPKGEKAAKIAVRKNPFEVTFIAEQPAFKQLLNAIVENKAQFLIPRLVIVKNTTPTGPPRVAPGSAVIPVAPPPPPPPPTNPDGTPVAAPAAPAAPATPAPVAAAPAATYIVGEERVDVRLLLDAVDFGEAAPAAKEGAAAAK